MVDRLDQTCNCFLDLSKEITWTVIYRGGGVKKGTVILLYLALSVSPA